MSFEWRSRGLRCAQCPQILLRVKPPVYRLLEAPQEPFCRPEPAATQPPRRHPAAQVSNVIGLRPDCAEDVAGSALDEALSAWTSCGGLNAGIGILADLVVSGRSNGAKLAGSILVLPGA